MGKAFNPSHFVSAVVLLCVVVSVGCKPQDGQVIGQMKKAVSSTEAEAKDPESAGALVKQSVADQVPALPDSDIRLFLNDTAVVGKAVGPRELTEAELNKNFCLLTLADEPDIRARSLTKYLRHVLTEAQKRDALEYLLSHDHKFQKLKHRRDEVLEHALDGQDIKSLLREIEVETVNLSQALRIDVYNKFLTQQQKQFLEEERNQKQAEAGREAEAKLKTEAINQEQVAGNPPQSATK